MKKNDNEHSSTDVSREEIKIFLIDGKKYNEEEIKNQFNIDDYKIQLIFQKFKCYPNQFKFNNENEVIPTVVGIFIFTEIKIHILIFPKNFNETDNNLNKDNFLIIFLTIRKYIEKDKEDKKITNTETENKDHIYEIFETYFLSKEMLSSELVKTDKICNYLTTEIVNKFKNFFKENEQETKHVVIDTGSNDIKQKIEHLNKLLERRKPNEWKLIYILIEYLKDQYLNRTIKFFVSSKKFDYLWQKVCETVYGNHKEDEIEQHKLLLKEKNKNKKQIKDIFKINKENGKGDTIPDQILIFDNQEKIFVIDSKFYKDPTEIDGRKEWHYGFIVKQWLVHDSCKIFILFFIPSLSDKIKQHYFVDWIIHKNYNENDKLEKIDDFLLIAWRVEISMIKIFQHYLISDKEKENLTDFNPLEKHVNMQLRSNENKSKLGWLFLGILLRFVFWYFILKFLHIY